ncbi:glucosamine-6-phosphate deaminase [Micrococcus luteus]|uniref:Glucosamine-6-phosphate deaminase n=1 Tax=Micrococcus luteus TaxID=1270 RepID=A0ABD7M5H7_MICLU|nr:MULTISPECIES: glucosamine-6-phosphate deaminase [Micrococcus]KZE63090.1 glucosamine-6-phosphate deaminase [Micrococcus aloeverae]MBE1538579.1 glucosamine-6-phosphate deaminase [Micrococcus yunnanensis]MBF0745304.1 glucosamine-6-phosphate deaminase [Micrococcus yunnanensis]MCD0172430.1 glucosamine-6-phosphate deaminase [Micrococcus luteus]MCK6056447.1 glucosamine-6-phosphate deaminase [Micrococcus luteus]
MEVVILPDAAALGRHGADAVAAHVAARPEAVLGLATGSSPLPVYDELARRVRDGELSLRSCRAFLLDEYVGLPAGHPESYRTVIEREFVARTDIAPEAVHGPDGGAADVPGACAAYEEALREAGGVDVQLLGVGTDGHIAFNEPGSSLASRTRIKVLAEQTRRDNARFFDGDLDQVPTHCLTQGVGTILDARHLVLLARGEGKAEAVRQLVEGPVSARWPVTALQLHPHVTVLVDEAAAGRLELAGEYRHMWEAKPSWQGL